jgi:hypothetical protein
VNAEGFAPKGLLDHASRIVASLDSNHFRWRAQPFHQVDKIAISAYDGKKS